LLKIDTTDNSIKEFIKPQEMDAHELLKEFLKTLSFQDMKRKNEKQEIKKMDQEIEIIFNDPLHERTKFENLFSTELKIDENNKQFLQTISLKIRNKARNNQFEFTDLMDAFIQNRKLVNNKPDILIFHIQREQNDNEVNIVFDSLNVDCLYKEELDILYDLISIVYPEENGNYATYCREGEKWFRYSKGKEEVDIENNLISDSIKKKSNLLFYKKRQKTFKSLDWAWYSKFVLYL
jgi:hypothetical protein